MSTDGASNSLINGLQGRLEELTRKLSNRVEQSKRLKDENEALKAKVTELETATTGLTTDRDRYKMQAESAPSEKDAEIAKLRGEIKSRDLRDLFTTTAAKGLSVEVERDGKKVTETLKVKPSAMMPLLDQLKLKPNDKGELPTEAQITEALHGAVTAHDWAFQGETPSSAADAASRSLKTHAATAGPGANRTVNDNTLKPVPAGSNGTSSGFRI